MPKLRRRRREEEEEEEEEEKGGYIVGFLTGALTLKTARFRALVNVKREIRALTPMGIDERQEEGEASQGLPERPRPSPHIRAVSSR